MDEIQRRLELIDKQLSGGTVAVFHKRIIAGCPLVFVAAGIIAGIVIQNTLNLPVTMWLILAVVFAASAIWVFAANSLHPLREANPPYAIAYTALGCFACVGAISLANFQQPCPNDIRNFVGEEQRLATIRGLVVTEPYTDQQEWEFAKFRISDPTSSFYLRLEEVEANSGWRKVTGTVRVQVDGPVVDLKAGDLIQAYCWLDRFKQPANPGQFNVAKYLAWSNVFVAASVKSRDGIEVLQSDCGGMFTRVKGKLRQAATQALLGDAPPEEQSSALVQALLLGYRGNIDSSTYRAFRETGLVHFISLSGLHFGILLGIVWWLCKTAGLMRRGRAVICIMAIGIFLMVVPPSAPTLRAAIIAFVFCLSFLFGRKTNSFNTLALAAIALLLVKPTQLFEVGWQLSFATMLGIMVFTNHIHFFVYEKITTHRWKKDRPKTNVLLRIMAKPGPWVLNVFSMGLAAWLGGAGLMLYHFGTVTPMTTIWTVLASPLVGMILTLGFLKIILFFLLPTVSGVLGAIVGVLSRLLIGLVETIARLNISGILIGHASLWPVILYYVFILFAVFFYLRRPAVKKVISISMAMGIVIFLGAGKWQRTHHDDLIVTILDVGHGQAILAQLPGKANILFDAGSLYGDNVGERIIVPFLNYSGIDKIDALVVTHNDIDHINGVPEVVDNCKVNRVYTSAAFGVGKDTWGTAQYLKNRLSEQGLAIRTLGDRLEIESDANVKVLWPIEQICLREDLDDNDKSVVCLVKFAARSLLFCSDIGEFAQKELLRLYPALEADIVVMPHHGSIKTLNPGFIKRLGADILICSCGRDQYEKQQVFRPKDEAGLFYTPKHGAITVCINKDGQVKVRTFAKEKKPSLK